MTNPLGTFVPKVAATGDRFQAKTAVGRPLLVRVTGYDAAKEVLNRNTNQREQKGAVYVDIWDFVGGPGDPYNQVPAAPANSVYIGVMWMAGALVDNLAPWLNGPPMPVKIIARPNQRTQGSHLALVPLEGQELAAVSAAFNQDPGRFDRETQARIAAQAAQQFAPAAQQTGFAPVQVQPSAPSQPGWNQQAAPAQQWQAAPPAQPVQQAPAAQWGAPAGAPGPIASTPAQVAQGWSEVGTAIQGTPQPQFVPGPPAQAAPQTASAQPPAPQFAAPGQLPGQLQVNDANVAQLLAGLTGQQAQG